MATAVALIGCTESRGSLDGLSGFGTSGTSGVPQESTTAEGSAGGSSQASSAGAPKLDVAGGDMDSAGDVMGGCQKVDFLFVVDNSGSMEDEQLNLVNSFPGS